MIGFTRRFFLWIGTVGGAATLLGITNRRAAASDDDDDDREDDDYEDDRDDDDRDDDEEKDRRENGQSGSFFGYTPFTQDLFVPAVLTALPPDTLIPTPAAIAARGPIRPRGYCDDVAHGIAPEFGLCSDWNQTGIGDTHAQEFLLVTEETLHRFVPDGPEVPIFSYRDGTAAPGSGTTPGPTVLVDYLGPVVVRNCNLLTRDRSPVNSTGHDHETSIHLHGTHSPSHADGYPDFYVLAGEARDYFYPNTAPRETDPGTNVAPCDSGPFDTTWIPSTLWYHDHAMDVTGFNVSRGLAGFYLVKDEREQMLADSGVIPAIGGSQDIGLALQDQLFNRDGTLHYDFLDHDGRLGNIFTVNGLVQPRLKVQRRKYRFRFLNASNARMYELRLSTRQKMCIIGTDSWLLPRAIEVERFRLSIAQRHDVIIDFRNAPDEVFLENILVQDDGRGADEVDPTEQRDLLLKFEVSGPNSWEPRCEEGTVIRGLKGIDPSGQWSPIRKDEIVKSRFFEFHRSSGAWQVNDRFFNPRRADAVPALGVGAERWLFENSSGGWWHPIHTHLEGFQIKRVDGRLPRRERRFNSDTVELEGGFLAELYMKFRTFTGPFVFHCHNIEHEDMRMMATHDPTPVDGGPDALIDATPPMDGETRINSAQSGVVPDCIELEQERRLFFDKVGDLDRIEDEGVGFPECEFDPGRDD